MNTGSLPKMSEETVIRPYTPEAPAATPRWQPRADLWRGLLWCEWFAHSKLLLVFLAAWLLIVWSLPFFAHPGWILLLGGIYALFAGPAYGGGEVVDGCEEFSFSLPATRAERYVARLVVGGGTLLLFTIMDLLALGLDLSQALARFYLDTGLIRPRQLTQPGLLYGLVLALPSAVFAFSFAWAAVTHSRAQVFTAWFWGGLAGLVVLRAGFQYEQLMWGKINGLVACPLLLAAAGGALVTGYVGYRRKEVGPPSLPLQLPGRWWAWAIFFLLGLGLALVLISWLARQVPMFLAAP